jgi:LPXTG-motif cell wall-anchored protein
LQDGLLFAVGAAAILVGAGSILYRRRLTRNR